MTSRRIAAIDLGTNTTLMLVAEVDAANVFRVLEDRATITRLGRGVDQTRRLDPEKIARTHQVLRDYATLARSLDAPIVAVGTSALRDADNRDDFLLPAEAILGTKVQAIAGEREAELTFRGALVGIDLGPDPVTVVDIGGGSTEIIVGANGRLLQRISLDVGSVRMHERHGMTAPASSDQVLRVCSDIRAMLATVPFQPAPRLLAIAGTATTLAAIAGNVDPYDPVRVHGSRLAALTLRRQTQNLLSSSVDTRRKIPGLHPERADVIAAGALILRELMDWSGASDVVVSDGGVRFGLALEALRPPGVD